MSTPCSEYARAKPSVSTARAARPALRVQCRRDPAHLARIAKLLAGEAALFCGKTGIQVHGGMGFTWEVDAQRYWKRACVLDTHLASGDRLAEQVAATL